MRVSVLICTYQRHQMLKDALSALVDGTTEKPDQVVVVNGGDEQADEVVGHFAGKSLVEVKLVKTQNRNLAASRNVGLPHCVGDVVAMTDDDAKVFPNWITQMKRAHNDHPEAGAVGGPVVGTNTDSVVGKVADLIAFPSWPEARYARTLPGVNLSYKREALERVGQQDEHLFRGEDVDYNWRVLEAGYKLYYDPDIKVYHHHRPTMGALLHQFYMYGRAYYLVRRKWPNMYSIYPHGIHGLKDGLKAVNFVAEALYGPFCNAWKLRGWRSRLEALPVVLCTGIAWRTGILSQMFYYSRVRAT